MVAAGLPDEVVTSSATRKAQPHQPHLSFRTMCQVPSASWRSGRFTTFDTAPPWTPILAPGTLRREPTAGSAAEVDPDRCRADRHAGGPGAVAELPSVRPHRGRDMSVGHAPQAAKRSERSGLARSRRARSRCAPRSRTSPRATGSAAVRPASGARCRGPRRPNDRRARCRSPAGSSRSCADTGSTTGRAGASSRPCGSGSANRCPGTRPSAWCWPRTCSRLLPRRPGRVVLDDRDRRTEAPSPLPVVALGVGAHLVAAAVAVRDRLPHDRRAGATRCRPRPRRPPPPSSIGSTGAVHGPRDRDRRHHEDTDCERARHPAAARTRSTVRSRPSSSNDSGSGGDTLEPVTAARMGCQPFVRLSSAPPASSSSAAWMSSRSHRSKASSRSAASLRKPAGASHQVRGLLVGRHVVGEQEPSSAGALGEGLHPLADDRHRAGEHARIDGQPLGREERDAARGQVVLVEIWM